MILYGIDPAMNHTGWCRFEGKKLILWGVVVPPKGMEPQERLCFTGKAFEEKWKPIKSGLIVVMEDSYIKYAHVAKSLNRLQGILSWLGGLYAEKVVFYTPQHIRKVVGVGGNASKDKVNTHMRAKFRIKKINYDESDAIATGAAYLLEEGVLRWTKKRKI